LIDKAYCRRMARYNTWQNKALWALIGLMPQADLTADAGLPQKFVLASLNQLLWLDRMWLWRLHGIRAPVTPADKSTQMTVNSADWWAERFRVNGALRMWAVTLASLDLTDDMAFYLISLKQDMIESREICIMHMFNQQIDQRANVRGHLFKLGHVLDSTNLLQMTKV
jgi:uncharacterized damage-inducible protein DinB